MIRLDANCAIGFDTPEQAINEVLAGYFFLDSAELQVGKWSGNRQTMEAFSDQGDRLVSLRVGPAPGDPDTYLVYTAEGCCRNCPSSGEGEDR